MKANDIKRVACLGGGIIGSSWAIQFAMHGLEVCIRDINEEQLEKSRLQMEHSLDTLESSQAISKRQKAEILGRISMTVSVEEALKGAQFVQENGPERLEIKRSILADVDRVTAPDVIYASSTSGLTITAIAEGSAHPERCIGAHPYNPPHLIPLVELMEGAQTSKEVTQTAYDFYQSVGKEAVLLRKECPGFISNRLQLAIYREMVDLVQRGVCSVEDVDKALVYGPGLRWAFLGQFMLMEIGHVDGFEAMMAMLRPGGNTWLPGMGNWTQLPEDWSAFNEGVQEEMAHAPARIGHTDADYVAYRDKMLIAALKLHEKL